MKMIHMQIPGFEDATLEGYILDCEISLGQEANRPAIVVCPGGGYVYCSPREAEPIALAYAARGFHAFILRYSTGRNCAGMKPLEEVDWVIGYLRQNAAEFHIDPEKILTCGFSAGGHLALSAGLLANNKPNGMILSYPVVSLPNIPGPDYVLKLLTGKDVVTAEDAAQNDLLRRITADAPPVFVVATAEDMLTNFGALPLINAYAGKGLKYELHIFQHGPHGYALANEVSADGSCQVINSSYAQWLEMSVQWLHKVFGQPQLVDRSTSKMGKYMQELGFAAPGQNGDRHA